MSLASPLKRIAQVTMGFSDAQLYGTQEEKEAIDPRYGMSARVFLQNAPKAVKRESPHDILMAYSFAETEPLDSQQPGVVTPSDGRVRVGVSSATSQEAVSCVNADNDDRERLQREAYPVPVK